MKEPKDEKMEEAMDTLLAGGLTQCMTTDDPKFAEFQELCRLYCEQWELLKALVFKEELSPISEEERLEYFHNDELAGTRHCIFTGWVSKAQECLMELKVYGDKYTQRDTWQRAAVVQFNNYVGGEAFYPQFNKADCGEFRPHVDSHLIIEDGKLVIYQAPEREPNDIEELLHTLLNRR
jgi:hypothetical protein